MVSQQSSSGFHVICQWFWICCWSAELSLIHWLTCCLKKKMEKWEQRYGDLNVGRSHKGRCLVKYKQWMLCQQCFFIILDFFQRKPFQANHHVWMKDKCIEEDLSLHHMGSFKHRPSLSWLLINESSQSAGWLHTRSVSSEQSVGSPMNHRIQMVSWWKSKNDGKPKGEIHEAGWLVINVLAPVDISITTSSITFGTF